MTEKEVELREKQYIETLEKVAKILGRGSFDGMGHAYGFFVGPDDGPFLTFNDEPDWIFGYCYTDGEDCSQQGTITEMFPDQEITHELIAEYIRVISKKYGLEV